MREPEESPSTPEAIALVHRLFLKHSPDIRAYLLALVSDVNVVDDLLHSTFVTATAKAAGFTPGTNFVAWARAIARIELLRLGRDRRRGPRLMSPEAIEAVSTDVPPFELEDERLAIVAMCIDKLAPRARKAVELRYRQGLKPPQISSRMALALASVNELLSRGRAAVRTCVERALRQREGGPR